MPEWPEIACRRQEMKALLIGRSIDEVEVLQPKCLNIPPKAFIEAVSGCSICDVTSHGKWLFVTMDRGHLLLNLGMGGEIVLVSDALMPEAWRIRFRLDGPSDVHEWLVIHFWWFGYAHYVAAGDLASHAMTARLGPDAMEIGLEEFRKGLHGRRGRIKAYLLDQSKIAGIGNAYVHDILFRARIHPLRSIASLTASEVKGLHAAIRGELKRSLDLGGASYEVSVRRVPGGFGADDLLVAYREGLPCPTCGATILKIKTGSNASFICPRCQRNASAGSG